MGAWCRFGARNSATWHVACQLHHMGAVDTLRRANGAGAPRLRLHSDCNRSGGSLRKGPRKLRDAFPGDDAGASPSVSVEATFKRRVLAEVPFFVQRGDENCHCGDVPSDEL
jgi:hypothetical protein